MMKAMTATPPMVPTITAIMYFSGDEEEEEEKEEEDDEREEVEGEEVEVAKCQLSHALHRDRQSAGAM